MCIVIYKPEGKILPKSHLKNSWQSNKHGAGFAYADGEKVHIMKGFMHFKQFWRKYIEHQEKAMVIHFRIATCGSVCPANTHPFRVNDQCAMAHNGVLTIRPPEGVDMTDSEVFLRAVIQPCIGDEPANAKLWLNSFSLRYLVEKAVSGSKLVFLHADGSATIYNESSGDWVDGVWYSNTSYKWGRIHYGSSYTTYGGSSWGTEYDYYGESWDSWRDVPSGRTSATTGWQNPKDKRIYEFRKPKKTSKKKAEDTKHTKSGEQNRQAIVITKEEAGNETKSDQLFPIRNSVLFNELMEEVGMLSEKRLLAITAYLLAGYGIDVLSGQIYRQIYEYEQYLRNDKPKLYFLFENYYYPLDYHAVATLEAHYERIIKMNLGAKLRTEFQEWIASGVEPGIPYITTTTESGNGGEIGSEELADDVVIEGVSNDNDYEKEPQGSRDLIGY